MNVIAEQLLLDLQTDLPPRYNIAPTQDVAAVWHPEQANSPELVMLQWGLIRMALPLITQRVTARRRGRNA